MNGIAELVGSVRGFVGSVVASLAASALWFLATGQPITLIPGITRALHSWGPLLGVVCMMLYVLTIMSGALLSRSKPHDGRIRARSGDHGIALAGERIEGNVINSHNTNVTGGIADELRQKRNRPQEFRSTMRAIGTFVNHDDPDWERVAGTDGSFRLVPRHPNAHIRRPIRVQITTTTPQGEPTLLDLLQQAAVDQQPFTMDGDKLRRVQEFLGDDVMLDSAENPDARFSVTVQAESLASPRRYVLQVPGTNARLSNLELGLFALPEGRLRLTNRQDQSAPIWVWIDFDAPSPEAIATVGPDDMILGDHGRFSFNLATRAVPGRTARHILALYAVLRALQQPRRVEIVNDVTTAVEYVFYGSLSGGLQGDEVAFVDALTAVQDAFTTTLFDLSTTPSADDVQTLFYVAHIVTMGMVTGTFEGATMDLPVGTARAVLDAADERGMLLHQGAVAIMSVQQPEEGVHLFGTQIDLGVSTMELPLIRIDGDVAALRAQLAGLSEDELLPISIAPADNATRGFTRRYDNFTPRQQAS